MFAFTYYVACRLHWIRMLRQFANNLKHKVFKVFFCLKKSCSWGWIFLSNRHKIQSRLQRALHGLNLVIQCPYFFVHKSSPNCQFSLFFLGQTACRNPVSKVDRCMDSTQIAFNFERCPSQQTDSRGKNFYIFIQSLLNHTN